MTTPKDAPKPDWDSLYRVAAAQAGYFTVRQAAEEGYSRPLLHHHVTHGRMERWGRGILRLVHFPPTDHEELVPAWLWSDRQGVFSHETALMLHSLSDAHPAKMHLTLPRAWALRRLRVPKAIVVTFDDVPKADRTWVGPIPVTTPLRSIVDCIESHAPAEFTRAATREGISRRLFSPTKVRASLRRAGGRLAEPWRPKRPR